MSAKSPRHLTVPIEMGWESWRLSARYLLGQRIPPERVQWLAPGSLFDDPDWANKCARQEPAQLKVPRDFLCIARRVAHHRRESRCALLYRLLWRLLHGEAHVLRVAADADVAELLRLDAAVRRSSHKTKAFVRFRQVNTDDDETHFVAWHQPEHPVLPLVASFFAKRFSDMRWSILTPDASLHFDGRRWQLGPGQPRHAAPTSDVLESLWRDYYCAIFNPTRVMVRAMQSEMPKRHWPTLPETVEIPRLLAEAQQQVDEMIAMQKTMPSPAPLLRQPLRALSDVQQQLRQCRACGCCSQSKPSVLGCGSDHPSLVVLGDVPHADDHRAGHAFAGRHGALLEDALQVAAIEREHVYMTHAFKHMGSDSGKRPRASQQGACRNWLIAELEQLKPKVVLCLGLHAARVLLGAHLNLRQPRGQVFKTPWAAAAMVTCHPRKLQDPQNSNQAKQCWDTLVGDLKRAKTLFSQTPC